MYSCNANVYGVRGSRTDRPTVPTEWSRLDRAEKVAVGEGYQSDRPGPANQSPGFIQTSDRSLHSIHAPGHQWHDARYTDCDCSKKLRRSLAESIDKAKQKGKYRGRRSDPALHEKIYKLRVENGLSINETAELANVSARTVIRVAKNMQQAKGQLWSFRHGSASTEALRG